MSYFTLHVRLTKGCNADCSYCSSWEASHTSAMSEHDFESAIDFIIDRVIPVMRPNGNLQHITIQYLGGEVLTVPKSTLSGCVFYARSAFGSVFNSVRDGVQSNLIGSPERVSFLNAIFGRNIGTSIDTFGDQRTVGKSSALYKELANAGRNFLKERRKLNPSSVFVVDKQGIHNARKEARLAQNEGYDLTLRPVFEGGRSVNSASIEELIETYCGIFEDWFLKQDIILEPFFQLASSRVQNLTGDRELQGTFACPFQSNCAFVSLSLDPDGKIYVCQDMADSDQFCLGNAVEGTFDLENWEMLSKRRHHLDTSCAVCPYRKECHGGCMAEAIHHTGSPYGKTELCSLWKAIFRAIDQKIEEHGWEEVVKWLKKIQQK